MSNLVKEMVFLILQFLDEEKYKETIHTLERESGHFFNFKYFEEKVLLGEWDEVEKYLSGFTKLDDNHFSTKIFFEIRKQKYLEALDRHDMGKAVEMIARDLKVFTPYYEEDYKTLALLITTKNFREKIQLSAIGDIKSLRGIVLITIKNLIKANPLLREKLAIPAINASRLRTLITQSLNWQHYTCNNPMPNPLVETLFTDHLCLPQNEARAPTPVLPVAAVAKPSTYAPLGVHGGPFQPTSAPNANVLAGCMANPIPVPESPIPESPIPTMEEARNVESVEKTKPSELMEIVSPAQCRQVLMQASVSKVARLLYTNSGDGILVLGAKGDQSLWKWSPSEQNPTGKGSASVTPEHWLPKCGLLMANDVPENPEESVPCIALSKNNYVMSACGGKVSLFNMNNFKVMTTFMTPPPASTFLLFLPQDNNIAAIGMEESTIHIYDMRLSTLKAMLKGHQKHITGLAFSATLNILVSSGADAQLCFWSADSWEKKNSSAIQLPAGKSLVGDTRVQFHNDQVHLLVSHETQIAIYDGSCMECVQMWEPEQSLSSPITCASYSCNSQLVYASFADGNIGVFDAVYLTLRCRIAPLAYMHQPTPNSAPVMPLVITAHPQEPNQIAVGLSDGLVKVLEPHEPFGSWGVSEKAGTECVGG